MSKASPHHQPPPIWPQDHQEGDRPVRKTSPRNADEAPWAVWVMAASSNGISRIRASTTGASWSATLRAPASPRRCSPTGSGRTPSGLETSAPRQSAWSRWAHPIEGFHMVRARRQRTVTRFRLVYGLAALHSGVIDARGRSAPAPVHCRREHIGSAVVAGGVEAQPFAIDHVPGDLRCHQAFAFDNRSADPGPVWAHDAGPPESIRGDVFVSQAGRWWVPGLPSRHRSPADTAGFRLTHGARNEMIRACGY